MRAVAFCQGLGHITFRIGQHRIGKVQHRGDILGDLGRISRFAR